MVGKINMKQLRRQEERAKKKAATREMDQQQCTEYFEQGSKGDSAASTKGINRKGKGKEEKKKRDREEEDKLPTLLWHGELESDSISFPSDLETAYETLQMKPSTDASEVVEDLLDKLGHLSFHSYHEAVEASSILGCILLVLCDRTELFDSVYYVAIQFIYALEANRYLGRLRLPLPRIPNFGKPSIVPNFPKLSDDPRSIRAKLSKTLINAQYRTTVKPTFATGGEELYTDGESKVDEGDQGKVVIAELKNTQHRLQTENNEIRNRRDKLKLEIEELKKVNEVLASEKEIANSYATLAQLSKQSKGETKDSTDSSELKEQLEEARKEVTVKTAEIASLLEREERTNVESKKMRERSRKQLSEKDEVIKELRESNSKLTMDIATATAQTALDDDKLKTELADVKVQLREAQAKSTSFSEFKDCISLQSKVSKELAVEVARLKGSSSFSTSSPSFSDKKDFVISTLSKKVIDLSKQVKEQNEQLAEMMIVMSKPDND
ncbi:hypothetical protein JCM5353_001631 [Sporobolomyces roseus]